MKRVLFCFFAALLGTVAIIAMAELFFRLNPTFGYIYHSCNINTDLSTGFLKYFTKENSVYRPSQVLGYERIPNHRDANTYGLVGKEYPLRKDNNVFRILILGDSIDKSNWGGQSLENILNQSPELSQKYKFQVWNASCGGYDIARYANFLKHKGLGYNPDMVVIFFCLNDFDVDTTIYYVNKNKTISYDFGISEISKYYVPNHFLLRHSFLYRFIILKINGVLTAVARTKEANQYSSSIYYVQQIKKMCEKNKIALFTEVFPYLKPLSDYNKIEMNEYGIILKTLEEKNINYVNLHDYLPESELVKLRTNTNDQIHPSQQAHHICANILYNYLLDNFFRTRKDN